MIHHGASAPGKLMIAGEYAVLHGGLALVAAVDARAVARWSVRRDGSAGDPAGSRGSAGMAPEVVVARRLAEQQFGAMRDDLDLDVNALRASGLKLGLGSSAAAAAATVGAVMARAGQALDRPETQRIALDLALEGHRAVAPDGSGADVAAAVLGGLVVFARDGGRVDAVPMAPPAGIDVRVVWTGKEARTSDFLARVAAFRARDAAAHDAAMARIGAASTVLVQAMARDDAATAIDAVSAHHEALAALGDAAGAPIVEEQLARIAALAQEHGGAAKPSGAGGGDVAIAFFRTDGATAFVAACGAAGLQVLNVPLYAEGLRAETFEAHP
jgi:phosphomevalonate kinase